MTAAYRAPGRVNLIGEHVDYAGGLVLPAAIERSITLTGEPCDGGVVRIESIERRSVAEVDTANLGAVQHGWARYLAAVLVELVDAGVSVSGYQGTVESDLPAGAGLSSSAALEVCLAGGLSRAFGAPLGGMELAELANRSELRAVGVPCGIMDQAASVFGLRDHALLLDCGTLEHRPVVLPAELSLVILDSGVRRSLEGSPYGERRAEVTRALDVLPAGAARSWEPERALAHAGAAGLDERALRRLRHVLTERGRVEGVVRALESSPIGPDLGRLFAAGHASLRDDFEVSVPELDQLVELAYEEGAVAARMTGGGFGGAVIALVQAENADAVGARVIDRYVATTEHIGAHLVTRAAAGASPEPVSAGQN